MTNEKTILIYTIITGLWNIFNIFQLDSKISKQIGDVLSSLDYILPMINHIVRILTVIYLAPIIKVLASSELMYIIVTILSSIILGTLVELVIRMFVFPKGGEDEQLVN